MSPSRIAAFVVLAALLAGALGWWWHRGASPERTQYRTARVERGDIASVVSSSGTLNAVTVVQVGTQVSGQVKEIFADFNTPVKKDQVIARIDPATFELRVNQARADLEAARSAVSVQRSATAAQQAELARVRINLADAERDYERKRMLVERNYISPAERDKAKTLMDATRQQARAIEAQIGVTESQVQSALAAVKQREALLRQSEVDLERTIIRAPVDGTVILRNVDAGQTVAASLQAPVLFTIARDLRDMQVEAAIDEADIGRLRTGQAATFTVDAFPRRSFSGEIQQIRKAPQNVQNVISYTVVISASNTDLTLLPGMTANVRIAVERRENVLKIPNAALRFRPANAEAPKPAAETTVAAPAAAPQGSAAQGGSQALARLRQRIVETVKPDADQTVKLDAVFEDMQRRLQEVREVQNAAERRRRVERIRADTRARIMEFLRPEQRTAYETLVASLGTRGRSSAGQVWVLDGDRPRPIDVRIGLSDGTSTELVSGDLKEASEVIIGATQATQRESSLPRMRLF